MLEKFLIGITFNSCSDTYTESCPGLLTLSCFWIGPHYAWTVESGKDTPETSSDGRQAMRVVQRLSRRHSGFFWLRFQLYNIQFVRMTNVSVLNRPSIGETWKREEKAVVRRRKRQQDTEVNKQFGVLRPVNHFRIQKAATECRNSR